MRSGAVSRLPGVFILVNLIQVYGIFIVRIGVNIKLQAARLVVVRPDSVTHGGLDKFGAVPSFNLGGYE
jgi:hypothetical protein